MHPTLHRYILGMKQATPDFDWKPTDLHNRLAEVLPAHAVYGLFRDAWQNEDHIFVNDELLLEKARKMIPQIERTMGRVFIERVFK